MDRTEPWPMQAAPTAPGTKAISRLDPPRLERRDIGLANRLSVKRRPIAFSIGDAALSFRPLGLGSISSERGATGPISIGLRLDGYPVLLHMSNGLFERILGRIGAELLVVDLDDEILPLLLEASLAEALTTADANFQGRIELLTIESGIPSEDDGLDLLFEIAIDGDTAGTASLRADRTVAERLADAFAKVPKARSIGKNLKTEISVRKGAIWLDLGELRSLQLGDVLLADNENAESEELAVTLGETWLLNARLDDAGLTLSGPLRRALQDDKDRWMMTDRKDPWDNDDDLPDIFDGEQEASLAADPQSDGNAIPELEPARTSEPLRDLPRDDARFDDVPIKLVFELGRIEVDLGRLQELGPGHVFELDRPIGEAVDVIAGGRSIGRGEIVRIDEQVGVRLVRLFGHG